MEPNGSRHGNSSAAASPKVARAQKLSTRAALRWTVRLEIWTLLCLHGAIFALAGVSHTATLYVGFLLGWLPPATTPTECAVFSPLGFALAAGPFLLVAMIFSGLAWRLCRLGKDWST